MWMRKSFFLLLVGMAWITLWSSSIQWVWCDSRKALSSDILQWLLQSLQIHRHGVSIYLCIFKLLSVMFSKSHFLSSLLCWLNLLLNSLYLCYFVEMLSPPSPVDFFEFSVLSCLGFGCFVTNCHVAQAGLNSVCGWSWSWIHHHLVTMMCVTMFTLELLFNSLLSWLMAKGQDILLTSHVSV